MPVDVHGDWQPPIGCVHKIRRESTVTARIEGQADNEKLIQV